MKAAPNCTVVTGTLRACAPAADGYGSHVEIDVASNESPSASGDFIKPQAGKTLRAFFPPQPAHDAAPALVGSHVQVTMTYLGGPSGGQAVVQSLKAK